MGVRTMIPAGTYMDSGYPVLGPRYVGVSARRAQPVSVVYLVEDDPDICEALEFMLTANGFEVVTCQSGSALLARLQPGTVASVLMDLRLPDVDGMDLLVTLRRQMPSWPVIVMTGFGQVQMAVRAMKLGALDFLEKPIDETELVGLLRCAIKPAAMRPHKPAGLLAELTARELETLSKLVKGLTSKQAAQLLGISPRTVDVHRASILQKLGAPTTMAALAMLRQMEPEQYRLLTEHPARLYARSQGQVPGD
ncbi:MAG: response regulator transcription factor [Acidobacteriota bacterium]